MLIDVIILSLCKSKDIYDININCIDTLIKSEKEHQFNIILMESNKGFFELGYGYDYDNVTVVIPEEDFNYNAFLNIGIRRSSAEFIVAANNDLIFKKNWFSEIVKSQKCFPDVHSFCPYDPDNEPNLSEIYPQDILFGYRLRKEMVGWCIVFDRKVLEKMPKFDERFSYYFQDNDYANEMRKSNMKHARVMTSHVVHLGSETSNQNDTFSYEHRGTEDEKVFLNKWGSYKKQHYRNRLHEILTANKLSFISRFLYWI